MPNEHEVSLEKKSIWQRKVPSFALALTLVATIGSCIQPLEGLYLVLSGSAKIGLVASVATVAFAVFTLLLSLLGSALMVLGMLRSISWSERPDGRIFDLLIPPEDADHRALAMEVAFDCWRERYSLRKAWFLYGIHTTSSVILYYIDRIKRGK